MATKKLSDLRSSDKVVVELGPVQGVKEGEVFTVKEKQNIAITKAAYELTEKTDKGYAPGLNRTFKLLGTPKYEQQESEAGGTIDVLVGVEDKLTE